MDCADILLQMKNSLLPIFFSSLWQKTPGFLKLLIVHSLLWGALCQLSALAKYSELQQQDKPIAFADLAIEWWLAAPGFIVLSLALQLFYQRKPIYATKPKFIALGFVLLTIIYLPLEMIYCAWLDILSTHGAINFYLIRQYVVAIHTFRWLTDITLMIGIYLASIAFSIWQQNRHHQHAWQKSQTNNLNLQLALEQQRLAGLRAQLEPHFIFNALSAISALVRSNDTPIAIDGINRLSNLLRYALDASNRDWVSFDEELQFIQNYLALQKLRYGERLVFDITGNDAAVLRYECLPLLLQPLVENALRHDLDCHHGTSRIHLEFLREDDRLRILLRNSVKNSSTRNPGFGMGLAHTKERLQLAYGNEAALHSTMQTDHFSVEILQPLYGA